MSKKPTLTIKEKRLADAKKELEAEGVDASVGTIKTTFVLEADLMFAVKEILLARKKRGIKPNSITGIIREALKNIVINKT